MASKVKSLDELKRIRRQTEENTRLRSGDNDERVVITIGMATCGIAAGAREAMTALREEVAANNLGNVAIIATGCLGYCYAEPIVEVRIPGQSPVRYGHVDPKRAREIVTKHVMQGELLDNEAIIGKEVPRA